MTPINRRSSLREWTTAGIPEVEHLSTWERVAAEAWVPVSVRPGGTGPMPSSVVAVDVSGLEVSRITTGPQSVERSAAQVEDDPGATFFLNLPLTTGTSASQGGRTADLRAGDFVVVDSARPFDLVFETPLRQLSIGIPHEMLLPRLARPEDVTGTPVLKDLGVGAVASGALQAMARSSWTIDRHTARGLREQLVELVALSLGAARGAQRIGGRDLLLQAALDEIERSLADPGLSPVIVADRIGISVRYLHRILSARGPSFARWVLERRLARAHDDLRDPGYAHWTIAAIALANGFTDPGHFSHVYKRRYGRTPRQTRGVRGDG